MAALPILAVQIAPAYPQTTPADSAYAPYERAEAERAEDAREGLERAAASFVASAELYQRLDQLENAAVAFGNAGSLYQRLSQQDSARIYLSRGLSLARKLDRHAHAAGLLTGLGSIHQSTGQADSALIYYQRALATLQEAAEVDPALHRTVLHNLGTAHDAIGRADSARAYFGRVLRLARDAADPADQAAALAALAHLDYTVGRLDQALTGFRHALRLARDIDDGPAQSWLRAGIATVHLALGRPDSAIAYHRKAVETAREVGDRETEMQSLEGLGATHSHLGRPAEARAAYEQALQIARETGDRRQAGILTASLAHLFQTRGHTDSALVRYREALEIARETRSPLDEADALSGIGEVEQALGQSEQALQRYGKALQMYKDLGVPTRASQALVSIGGVHLDLGRPDSALAHLHRALAIARRAAGPSGVAEALNRISAVHEVLGRPDSAAVYLRHALELSRETRDAQGEATALSNLGFIYRMLGQLDSARVYLGQGLRMVKTLRLRSGEMDVHNLIGLVEQDLGRPDSALAHYTRSLAIARELGDPFKEGIVLRNTGEVFHTLGRADSALAHLRPALAIARMTGNREGESIALETLGRVYRAMGSEVDLARAVAYYDSAAATIAQIAHHAGNDASQVSFREVTADLSGHWASAWLARRPISPENQMAALAAAERGRSRALLDLMRKSAGEAGLPVPVPGADLAAEGAQLVRGATASGAAVLSYLVTHDTLLAWLALPDGGVRVHRTAVSRDSLAAAVHAFRSALAVDSVAVRARMLTRDASLLEELAPPEDRLRSGRRTRRPPGSAGAWREPGRRLTELLLPAELVDALPVSGELIVVPHGATNLVPFSALPLASAELLGTRHALRYAPSLSTLARARERSRDPGAGAPLVVGNPAMPVVRSATGERVRLSPLPGAAEEGAGVAKRLGTETVSGDEATEGWLRERLPSASVVHLATHGYSYASEARARDSFIALAPDAEHDGLLTVGEVLDEVPALQAELVVLSACQTGLGDLKQAEGTVGLQRAFLAKGTRSVLVSLWSVSDEATETLMRRFYAYWQEQGLGKAEALRAAQEDLRSDPEHPEWAHPRFWAAFQLVGAR